MADQSKPSDEVDESSGDSREERLQRNTSSAPEEKTHEDEHNPMHADSWSGGSIVDEAKKIARGEAPRDRPGGGPNTPDPGKPATPSEVSRPWSPEPTEANTTGSSDEVDYAGKPKDASPDEGEEVVARQAPPTISPQGDKADDDRPEVTTRV